MKVIKKIKGLGFSIIFIFSMVIMNSNLAAASISTNETATISATVVDGTDDEYLVTTSFDGKLEEMSAGGNKLDVVLLLDNSGSMGGTPLDNAKTNSKMFASQILADPNNNVSIICFGSYATNYIGLNNSVANTHAAIDSITTNGGTYMSYGIDEVKNEFDANGRTDAKKVLVVLADGDDWSPSALATSTTNLLSAYPDLTIKTIGYNLYPGSSAETTLVNLAANDATSGEFFNASTDDLSTVFANIVNSIQTPIPTIEVTISVPANFDVVESSLVAPNADSAVDNGDGTITVKYTNVAPNTPLTIQYNIKINQKACEVGTNHSSNVIASTFTYDYTDDNNQPTQKVVDVTTDAPIYKITTQTDANGTISAGRYVGKGAAFNVSFQPKEGYRLDSLTDNGVNQTVSGDAYNLQNIDTDHVVKASFTNKVAAATAPSAPATGDTTNTSLWGMIVLATLITVGGLKLKKN